MLKNKTLPDFIIKGHPFIIINKGDPDLDLSDLSDSFTSDFINFNTDVIELLSGTGDELLILKISEYNKTWSSYEIVT